MPNNNLLNRIVNGAAWMVSLRLSIKVISVVSTMMLARLLTPADFGLMALVSSCYAMVELIRAFGFDIALIQNQQASREHYDTAWTMNIIFALLASSVIVVLSAIISNFYDDPRLTSALLVIALIIFIDGFWNIGTVEFKKQLNFKQEFKYQILTKLSGFCVTIPLAFWWHSYWALLCGMLSTTLTSVLLSYALQNYRPRLSLRAKSDLFGFCSWLLFNNMLQFVNKYSHNFILGKISGSNQLGIYSLADEIAMITTTDIITPINCAAYPGYSKLAYQREALKAVYLKTLSYIILIGLPCSIGVAAIAPLLVPVMLGNQWLAATPIIQLIALTSALESLNTTSNYIYLVLAKQYITTRLLCLKLILFLPLLVGLATYDGIKGAAIAVLVVSVVMLPVNFYKISRFLHIKANELSDIIYRPFFATLAMGAIIFFYAQQQQFQSNSFNLFLYLLIDILLGIIVYSCFLLFAWKLTGCQEGAEKTIMSSIVNKINTAF